MYDDRPCYNLPYKFCALMKIVNSLIIVFFFKNRVTKNFIKDKMTGRVNILFLIFEKIAGK